MAIQNEESTTSAQLMRQKYSAARRRSSSGGGAVSFSAELPDGVGAALRERCVCAVKFSRNPMREIRESIVEMVEKLGIRDWEGIEELIYCYLALNSSELHYFIEEAFLSLCFSRS